MARVPLLLIALSLAVPSFAFEIGPERELSTRAVEPLPFVNQHARVATNGTDFLVVWLHGYYQRYGELRAARIDRSGSLIDAVSFTIDSYTSSFAVASDGEDYAIAFECESEICIRRIDNATGTVLGGATITGATIAGAEQPAIASNGDGYVVAYVDRWRNSVAAVQLHSDASLAREPVSIGNGYSPAIASNDTDYYMVWRSQIDSRRGIRRWRCEKRAADHDSGRSLRANGGSFRRRRIRRPVARRSEAHPGRSSNRVTREDRCRGRRVSRRAAGHFPGERFRPRDDLDRHALFDRVQCRRGGL
jgi:hypothetical protein